MHLFNYRCSIILLLMLFEACFGQNYQYFEGPSENTEEAFAVWWTDFTSWIEEASLSVNLSIYDQDPTPWARTSFVQPQLMIHDRFLYGRYDIFTNDPMVTH